MLRNTFVQLQVWQKQKLYYNKFDRRKNEILPGPNELQHFLILL